MEELKEVKRLANKYEHDVTLSKEGFPIYKAKDLAFVNTSEATEVARHFKKYGKFTKAHPIYDKSDYDAFWDREEKRLKEGLYLPGKLVDGKIEKIHITGEHYGYLNYGQIKLTDDEKKGEEKVSKMRRKSGSKIITFPDFWDGDFNYFTARKLARSLGLNLCVGKARRKGYSYKNGWVCANKANLYPNSITLLGAFDSGYLYPEGTMAMADNYLQFIYKHTDWNKRRIIDREDHIKFGYRLNDGSGTEYGFKSQIICVSFGPNRAGAARGKDAEEIFIEESGKCPNLLDVYNATQPTLEDGQYVTGMMTFFGTGGGEDQNWEAFEEIFYNPELYNCLAFENIWDEDALGNSCSFFIPQSKNKPGFIDEHGNSLVEEAKKSEKEIIDRKKKFSKDPLAVDSYLQEFPETPSQAFSRKSTNIFPTAIIEKQLRRVENSEVFKNFGKAGILVNDGGIVKFESHEQLEAENRHDEIHPPINDFPFQKKTDPEGAVVIWYPPYKVGGRVPDNLYRIWHDPYAQDKDTEEITMKDSLGATYVYEVPNNLTSYRGDRIVAEYVGRPSRMDDYNEVLFNLAKYYNTHQGIMYENDRGDVKGYAQRHKLFEWLAPEPDIIWNKDINYKKTGREFGMSMSNIKFKGKAAIYLKDWLITPVKKGEDGKSLLNVHFIFSSGLLKELLKWSLKGNFDRTSALLVGQYDMKEVESKEIEASVPNVDVADVFDQMFG